MEVEIVEFVRRVKDEHGSYLLPNTSATVGRIVGTLNPDQPTHSAFLSVWEWIGAVLGVGNVGMHDMLALPIQYSMPENKALFKRMGFPMDRTFDLNTSKQVLTVLLENLVDEEWPLLWLTLNVQLRIKHKRKTNVVTKSWRKKGVVVLAYWLGQGVGVAAIMDAINTASTTLVEHDSLDNWAAALIQVIDPIVLLSALATQFTPREQNQLESMRERIVARQWPMEDSDQADYGDFMSNMITYETYIRNRNDPDMIQLFYDVQDDIPGRTAHVVSEILSSNMSRLRPDLPTFFVQNGLTFAGIQAGSTSWILSTVAAYVVLRDASGTRLKRRQVANFFLTHAVQEWTRRFEADEMFLPTWGQELLLHALLEDQSDGRMAIILSNVPNGRVPPGWIWGALELAKNEADPAAFRTLVDRLIDYGLINPKTYRHGPDRLTLVDLAARSLSDVDEMGNRFKQALALGAPYPSTAALASFHPDARTTFNLVTDAVRSMFRGR